MRGTTTVPEGHEVRLLGRTLEPSIGRMAGGLLVASTGCGGDHQEWEVTAMLEGLAAQVQPCAVSINADIMRLDELFAKSLPSTRTVASAAMVYFQRGSLAGLTDPALEAITTRLRDLGRQTRLFVGLEPAYDVSRIIPMLRKAGITVGLADNDGTIAAEVHRPDGAVVTGFVIAPLGERESPTPPDSESTDVLMRSPRYDKLVLEVVRSNNQHSRRKLEEYLKARKSPLALMASKNRTGEFAVQPRSWPGKQAFVAYADKRALLRAAGELGAPQTGEYAIAAMLPSQLFAWACSNEMAVVLCVFEDRANGTSEAWHVPFEVEDLRRLVR
jgi:hypothetical protein